MTARRPTGASGADDDFGMVPDAGTRRFAVVASVLTLAVLTGGLLVGLFTHALDGAAVGPVTWIYVQGLGQFVLAVLIGHLYVRVANRSDPPEVDE